MTVCRVIALVSLPWVVAATLVPRLSLEELVNSSEVIVEGRVVESHTAWDSNHRYIWTHYRMRVADPIKGGPGAEVVISEPGGTLDGESQRIADTVTFARGESVVIFAYRTPAGYLRTTGWTQGKFAVREGRVETSRGGVTLVDSVPNSRAATATPIESLNGTSLSGFKARVRRMIAARQAPR